MDTNGAQGHGESEDTRQFSAVPSQQYDQYGGYGGYGEYGGYDQYPPQYVVVTQDPQSAKFNWWPVVFSVLIFLLFVGLMSAAAGYLYSGLSGGKGDTTVAKPTSTPQTEKVTVTVTTEATPTTSETSTTSSTTSTTEANPKPSLLSDNGWSDDSSTQCSSSETLVFAGRDSSGDNITICKQDSTLRYRSNVNSGTLDDTRVSQTGTVEDGGYFSVNVPPSVIEVFGDHLDVYTNGKHTKTIEFTEWWAE